ncbi:MCE family protein [Aldersonia sp. NBC_00410]|uniref:MCE family protein n=1 Tax=Aldersonia sp. NBC_00410 TaxID=2975954 RepID=UPI00225C2D7F|nr:MCE family protein [Aldersonia sp. NBC_00410]MCX5043358.1 MCE family protein [Aldersonia sp. NBC_00410]
MKNTATTIKFIAFAVVMVLIFAALAIVFSQARFAGTTSYHAVFTSASGMKSGSKVRIAGVPVGTVGSVEVGSDNLAHVEFDVETKYPVLQSSKATIRYENLVGDRYLELMEGPGSTEKLESDGTIPVAQTAPALDLDMLLGGFKPLLRGLDPDQVNSLTAALIEVFQGQGDTLVSLLGRTGSFTKTLADRDAVIGSVIDNLNIVLKTVDDRGDQFSTTIDQLQQLISGLAADKDPIGAAIPQLASATGRLADLLQGTRPSLHETLVQTEGLATTLDDNSETLENVINALPGAFKRLSRLGAYGSFFQFYVCATTARFSGPDGKEIKINLPGADTSAGRCAG